MMIPMGIVVLCAIMLASCATAFSETPRDRNDVFCFLVMLTVSVAIVLVFVVKGA